MAAAKFLLELGLQGGHLRLLWPLWLWRLMQLQTRLQGRWSGSPGRETPPVNKVGALGQKRCWEPGGERQGSQSAAHLTQREEPWL